MLGIVLLIWCFHRVDQCLLKKFLIKNNVDPNRLYVIGFGESRPASDNDSPESRAENRRVEIKLIN